MCGRFVSPDTASIERAWHIGRSNSNPFGRRYNVLPTTNIPVLRGGAAGEAPALTEARWGLIPHWWKQEKPPQYCFNARSEDAAGKPMWRHAYRHQRCLVPAVGWYEWQAVQKTDPRSGKTKTYKQPHFIYRRDHGLVCFAALASTYAAAGKDPVLTCALLTRDAAPSVAMIHDRMPVVLPEPLFQSWLDPGLQAAEDIAALVGQAQIEFAHHPVSTRLNTAKTDDPGLVEEVAA